MKLQSTKRKFYNKWLYKVSLFCPGAALYRIKSYQECLDWLSSNKEKTVYPTYSYYNKALGNKNFKNITEFLSKLDPTTFGKRIESSTLDIYTNNFDLYQSLINEFSLFVFQAFAPSNIDIDALEENKIAAKKLAHKEYKYRVFLLPHKIKNTQEKINFISWLDTQQDRIKITDTVKRWFVTTSYNWDRRYMYVKDEKTLMLVKIRSADAVGRIYEYCVVDK